MITIYEQHGQRLVCSLEIYRTVGYNKTKYIRWLKTNIYDYAEKGVDYFDQQEAPSGKPIQGPKTTKYLLTFELAVAICLMSKTEKSKKLKKWLQQNR